jgi:hypothetical protein
VVVAQADKNWQRDETNVKRDYDAATDGGKESPTPRVARAAAQISEIAPHQNASVTQSGRKLGKSLTIGARHM